MEEKRTTCTVRLPEAIARQLKIKCIEKDTTIQEVLSKAVYDFLKETQEKK